MVLLCAAAPADAQVLALLRAIGEGGSWVKLPVENGRAEYRSPVFPVAGMAVNGCVKVWDGNPGSWTIRARDLLGETELEATTDREEPVRFQYEGGLQAQLDLVVEWSEPGSTTLYLWVGVSLQDQKDEDERDICEPPPRSGEAERAAQFPQVRHPGAWRPAHRAASRGRTPGRSAPHPVVGHQSRHLG